MRLIGAEGEMLGTFSAAEAWEKAKALGLDLIEIAPNAKPPTCKIMDYGRWKYENKKKANIARKNQVIVETKEVQVRPRTDQHDIDTKVRNATRFLLDGNKVKVNLRFSGREMAHQEQGHVVLDKVRQALDALAIVESAPKKEGRHLFMILAPDPVKIKDYKKAQAAIDKAEKAEKAQKEPEAPDQSK